jgi:hypothetical protein
VGVLVARLGWSCRRLVGRGGRQRYLGELLPIFLLTCVVGRSGHRRQIVERYVSWSWLVVVSVDDGLVVVSWQSYSSHSTLTRVDKSGGFSAPSESFARHFLPGGQCRHPRVSITSL